MLLAGPPLLAVSRLVVFFSPARFICFLLRSALLPLYSDEDHGKGEAAEEEAEDTDTERVAPPIDSILPSFGITIMASPPLPIAAEEDHTGAAGAVTVV